MAILSLDEQLAIMIANDAREAAGLPPIIPAGDPTPVPAPPPAPAPRKKASAADQRREAGRAARERALYDEVRAVTPGALATRSGGYKIVTPDYQYQDPRLATRVRLADIDDRLTRGRALLAAEADPARRARMAHRIAMMEETWPYLVALAERYGIDRAAPNWEARDRATATF